MGDTSDQKPTIPSISELIEQYPGLALPIGVIISLLGLATIIKSLVEGFSSTYEKLPLNEFIVVIIVIILVIVMFIKLANRALMPRPIIEDFQTPCLSRDLTIQWNYIVPKSKNITYRVVIKFQDGSRSDPDPLKVPEGMCHRALTGIHGEFKVKVEAMEGDEVVRSGRFVDAEVYPNAIQRIMKTGKLKVAIHQDPNEEIFCYYPVDKWEGFDIDFVNIIVDEMNSILPDEKKIEPKYLYYPWPAVIGSPNDFKVDMAIASISMSEKRKNDYKIMFSEPYAESSLGVVCQKLSFDENMGELIELDDLIGKRVAVHNETTASMLIEKLEQDENYKGKILFQVAFSNTELRDLLNSSAVDAVMYDYQRAFSMLDGGTFVRKLSHDIELEQDRYGVVFATISHKLKAMVDEIIITHRNELDEKLEKRLEDHYERIAEQAASII